MKRPFIFLWILLIANIGLLNAQEDSDNGTRTFLKGFNDTIIHKSVNSWSAMKQKSKEAFTIYKPHDTVLPAGTTAGNENGEVSYSIGQINFTAYSSNNGSVSGGVQQPYIVVENTPAGISIPNRAIVEMRVFPNPASDYLQLSFENNAKISFTVSLINIWGKKVYQQNLNKQHSRINLASYPAGNYFLTIEKEGQVIQSFTIIKK